MITFQCDKCGVHIPNEEGAAALSVSRLYPESNVDSGVFYKVHLCIVCFDELKRIIGKKA